MATVTRGRYGRWPHLLVRPIPYRFNESRRHKIPKARYRVINWAGIRRGAGQAWKPDGVDDRGGDRGMAGSVSDRVTCVGWNEAPLPGIRPLPEFGAQ